MKSAPPRRELPPEILALMRPRGTKESVEMELPPPLETAAGFEPNTEELTRVQAVHLLRRTCFGVSADRVNEFVGMPADEAVDTLVQEAYDASMPEPPPWWDSYPPWNGTALERRRYNANQFTWLQELTALWIGEMLSGGLREKLTLFWHDHFVTERKTYFFTVMSYQYMALLREYAVGNFKTFTRKVGLNPAMLVYLDGRLNTSESPNENYARELLELFTMGESDGDGNLNYTQDDVVELSRSLTGWFVDYTDFSVGFDREEADEGSKTIFGRSDTFDFESAHDVIFEERSRQIAEFIARKVYSEFVYVTPSDSIIAAMADVFEDNDFDLGPMVEALLKSKHFFEAETIGARIKSPVELIVGVLKDADADEEVTEFEVFRRIGTGMSNLGQYLFEPPNVAGWTGYRTWLSASLLPMRWDTLANLANGGPEDVQVNLVPTARKLVDPEDPLAVFKVPVALVQHLFAVRPSELSYDAPPDFGGDLVSYPIPQEIEDGPEYVKDLAKIFLAGSPWYEWSLNRQGIIYHMRQYLKYLTNLPEFQLA